MVSIKSLTLGLCAAGLSQALPGAQSSLQIASRWCGTPQPHAGLIEAHKSFREHERTAHKNKQSPAGAFANVTVPVYFHVAAKQDKSDDIKDDVLQKQYDVLAETYAKYGVSMSYKGSDHTYDDEIATGLLNSNGERDSKQQAAYDAYAKKVRQGGYDTLNVYFYTNFAADSGLLGLCYFPEETSKGEDVYFRDGCQINGGSVPGGALKDYNLGLTTVHEVGHWFGLLHVFQDQTCNADGDLVDDTPFQSQATSGCPAKADSCPNAEGADSVHNYMDYSTDPCMTEFTQGQKTRLTQQFQKFRAGK